MYIWEANPTIEDFREAKWQSIVASSDEKTCSAYRDLFRKHLDATQADSREQRVFAFLSYICAITLRVDSPDSPFVGLPINNGSISLEIIRLQLRL